MDNVQQQSNSTSDKSDTGAASSNRQENYNNRANMQGGLASAITDKIRNSDFQGWSTETVFINLTSGDQTSITLSDFIAAVQQQHQQYRQGTWDSEFIFMPRRVDVWTGGNTFLTVQFFETNQLVGQRCQFYAIGFEGAERGHIGYSWNPALIGPNPWKLNAQGQTSNNQNLFTVLSATTATTPSQQAIVMELTMSFKSVALVNSFTYFIKDSEEDTKKRQAEWYAMEKVKRAKALTMPPMDM